MSRLLKVLLVTLLELALFAPAMLEQKVDRGLRSLDDYWTESGLQENELETLLVGDVCNADLISYLSCVNAIAQMAEKFNLALNEQGQLEELTRKNIEKRITERSELTLWSTHYQIGKMISASRFMELWKELAQKATAKNKSAVIAAGMNGYLSVARDPHTYIIPLHFYEEVIAKSENKSTNLGFIARRNRDIAIVRKIFSGSPAEAAGLKKGDQILRMNGVEISAMLNTQFSEMLKVKDGDRLSLLIARKVNGKSVEKYMEILKKDFTIPSVDFSIQPLGSSNSQKNLGILTLHKFAKGTCQQAKSALQTLLEQDARGILLDLRDNPGGQVEEAACVLNLFIGKEKLLFETRYLEPGRPADRYVSDQKAIYRGPLAVLINSGSASAAEIVAGSLKDHKRATLVGERTFGKGSFQDGKIWGKHQKIAVFETEGMYYFPSGWTPQLVGIEPDLQVNFSVTDFHREEDLFYRPLRPKDMWVGPQSISWLQLMQCPESIMLWSDLALGLEDAQMAKAFEWLKCRNEGKVGSAE